MELTELDLMETKLRRWRACAKDKSCIVVLVSRSKALQLLYNIFATFQVPGEESALSWVSGDTAAHRGQNPFHNIYV